MPDKILTKNTPENLGVTPRYILQHNAISRSIHNLSATAKKLTALAMALLPPDLSSLTASFTFTDFCKSIGYEKGGESYRIFVTAVDECIKSVITIETEPNKKGKKKWKKFTWFTSAKYDEETGKVTMTFSTELAAILQELKKFYARINLKDMGQLQSKYAIRLFEMAKSYESLAGKNGNQEQSWYFERTISEFRELLGVPENAYEETHLFRQKVIEKPVKEINQAGIGLEIETESVKQGRRLAAIRLDCKQVPRTTIKKRRNKKAPINLPDSKSATQRQEKELEHLKELYPEEFAELYEEELAKPFLPFESGFRRLAAEAAALSRLKERYGIVK